MRTYIRTPYTRMTSFHEFRFLVISYKEKNWRRNNKRESERKKTINYIALLPFLLRNMTPRTDYLRVQEFNDEWKEERKDERANAIIIIMLLKKKSSWARIRAGGTTYFFDFFAFFYIFTLQIDLKKRNTKFLLDSTSNCTLLENTSRSIGNNYLHSFSTRFSNLASK